jgi:3-keto-5-aminohexanoate cleavage enzyme
LAKRRQWAAPPLSGYEPMIINVALTGAVSTKSDNPNVPITPEEFAASAIECARAGASIVHVHVRDEEGRPAHRRDLYERAIAPIREAVPQIVICVTTSGRVDADPEKRMTGLELEPPLKPDMASLTLGSFNFPTTVSHNPPDVIEALLRRMQERGIKPELEVFELGMVNTAHMLIERGLIDPDPYVNILLGSPGAAPAFVGHLAAIVERLPDEAVWAAAGIGAFQRPMVVAAAAMGGNVRTGLEDSPKWPDGTLPTNHEAVELAVSAARLVGREISTPSETRRRLGLAG